MVTRKKTSDQPPAGNFAAEVKPAETAAPATDSTPPSAEGVLRDTQAVVREALKNGDHRTALKGLEMLGKHFGLFGERAEAGAPASGQVLIYQLPDNGRDGLKDQGFERSPAGKA